MYCFHSGTLGQPSARANYMFFDHDRIWMHYGASTTERHTHKIKGVDWALLSVGCSYLLFIHQGLRYILMSAGLPINIWH